VAALTGDLVAGLVSRLEACTALIQTGDGRSNGAGFFVDASLLLTCAHVVGPGDTVEVTPYMRPTRSGRVKELRKVAEGDVALVEVSGHADDPGALPAALLDLHADEGDYHAIGFPDDPVAERGLETIRYVGHPSKSPETGKLLTIKLEGKQVNYGMSGGAVLNDQTGAVVAIVQYSKGTETVLGGGAIPISFVAQAFPEIADRVKAPPAAAQGWRKAVPDAVWAELGRSWPSFAPTFDIRVDGDLSKWLVGLETEGEPLQAVTVRDLGEEVAEVLFQWAAARRLRGQGEVNLLGRLLGGALLPETLATRLGDAQKADGLHVRLRVDPKNALADVPWELATPPGSEDGLGAERTFRFSRVAPELGAASSSVAPRTTTVPVMALVVQPAAYHYPDVFHEGAVYEWPKTVKEVCNRLRGAILAPFSASVWENPTPAAIDADLGDAKAGPVDVFHYIGVGRVLESKAELALFDGDDRFTWTPVEKVGDWIAQSGARVAIIELTPPPVGLDFETMPPTAAVAAMPPSVEAVVATRVPVHARQFAPFNDRLYACLANGDSIEAAVQAARRELQTNHPLGDYAGFAWFTLYTSDQAGLQLYLGEESQGTISQRGGPSTSSQGQGGQMSEDSQDAFDRPA